MVIVETEHFRVVEHDEDCDPSSPCECGRGTFHSCEYRSCYECFLDRRSEYVGCIYCDRWHAPQFDTCFKCRPQGRDEAARDLKLVILARDSFKCSYCSVVAGDLQLDQRIVKPGDDGIRPAVLHVDHIKPCKSGGTVDPWNLQTLCGVCNVAKADEWWLGSRHHQRRREVMDAYATYLWSYLTPEEKEALSDEIDIRQAGARWSGRPAAAERVLASYRAAVRARRTTP